MKLSRILLRWYKSFNVSYEVGAGDRVADAVNRPWNSWTLEGKREAVFPFVEIPIESDTTTIVGANESGKSHLLSAVSKVLTGRGIPGDPFSGQSKPGAYDQTDLCHFASLLGKNAEIWPHIGLTFSHLSRDEYKAIQNAAGQNAAPVPSSAEMPPVTLILGPQNTGAAGQLYMGSNTPTLLNEDLLDTVRKVLPNVRFINSQLPLPDQISLLELLSASGSEKYKDVVQYDHEAAQSAAHLISQIVFAQNNTLSEDAIKQLTEQKKRLSGAKVAPPNRVQLERLLFSDVLGINVETLEKLYELEEKDRGHAEALVGTWNQEIERTLNLSRYWQQDQDFRLRLNYKQGILYFEILDKTGAVYTFRERSSGLRYFLSYYIQAKALQQTQTTSDTIILMDEPDSFLSILGQRNLLSIFESLAHPDSGRKNTQLLYTTHSPFLINRNFPNRIRLVCKGDAEEGTQFVDQARVKRFEPVRSALGIDLAQTLFMGAINVVLEGPTDQYLVAELIRTFAGQEGTSDLLDLNAVVIVSAESAEGVEKIISSSKWTDEPVPTAVVVLDGDAAGIEVRKRITGKSRNCKQLVHPDFVLLIGEIIDPFGANSKILTIEDVIPVELYRDAIRRYVTRWHSHLDAKKLQMLESELKAEDFNLSGIAVGAHNLFNKVLHDSPREYDKMGVLQEVFELLPTSPSETKSQLKENIRKICQVLRRKIEMSATAERRRSGKQAVSRIIGDFFVRHTGSATPYDIELLLERLQREAESFGQDAERLNGLLAQLLADARRLRTSDTARVIRQDWESWKEKLEGIRKNPLSPTNGAQPAAAPNQSGAETSRVEAEGA